MNIVLYILVILFFAACSSAKTHRQSHHIDSTVITKDSFNVRTKRDSATVDSIIYHERQYSLAHNVPRKTKYAWWELLIVLGIALIVVFIKTN